MRSDERSDSQLVAAVLDGDRAAYAQLVGRYERSVRAMAMRVLADEHSAADAAQETFLAAYQKLGRLRRPASFGAWLLKIARRQALQTAKRSRRREALHRSPESLDDTQRNGRPDAGQRRLLDAVARLPDHEKLVVTSGWFGFAKSIGNTPSGSKFGSTGPPAFLPAA